MVYVVDVSREDGVWLGECAGLPGAHSFADSLQELRAGMVDAIILAADLPDDTQVDLDLRFRD